MLLHVIKKEDLDNEKKNSNNNSILDENLSKVLLNKHLN
jgi:hypothetical protein